MKIVNEGQKLADALQKVLDFQEQMNGVAKILCDPQERYATWTCLALTFFNEMSGIIILVYFIKETFVQ